MEKCWHCKSVEFYLKTKNDYVQKYFVNCDVIHDSEHKLFTVYSGYSTKTKVVILDDAIVGMSVTEK